MARQLRLEYPGAIYHVTVRGNGRQSLFRDAKDRHYLYKRLAESVPLYGVRLYLFCLMDNHLHLVMETPEGNLGRFMQALLTAYTVTFNLRHGRRGHLTQNRYGARVVRGDEYLLKLSRYVHLNPVKIESRRALPPAERLAWLKGYEWSSYRSYVGLAKRFEWVEYGPMLTLAGGPSAHRAERYRAFVEAGVAEDDEEFLAVMNRSARAIGDDEFREWVDGTYASHVQAHRRREDASFRTVGCKRVEPGLVLAAVAKAAGVEVEGLRARRRDWPWKGIAAQMLIRHSRLTQRDCAGRIGLGTGAAVSYQVRQAEQAVAADGKLRVTIARLSEGLRHGAR